MDANENRIRKVIHAEILKGNLGRIQSNLDTVVENLYQRECFGDVGRGDCRAYVERAIEDFWADAPIDNPATGESGKGKLTKTTRRYKWQDVRTEGPKPQRGN